MKNLSEHFTEKRSAYRRAPARAWTGLERAVEELFDSGEADISDRAMIWNAQQKAALDRSLEALACAIGALRSGELPDAACSSAEEALGEILSIDGRGVSEEIVSGIFARFCVGK